MLETVFMKHLNRYQTDDKRFYPFNGQGVMFIFLCKVTLLIRVFGKLICVFVN